MTTSTKLSIWAGVLAFAGIAASGTLENGDYLDRQHKLQKQEQDLRSQAKKDRQLISKVRDNLAKKGLAKNSDVDIRVYRKVAYLSGFASNEKDKVDTINAVENTPGLVAVNARDLRHVIDMPAVVVQPGRQADRRKLMASR